VAGAAAAELVPCGQPKLDGASTSSSQICKLEADNRLLSHEIQRLRNELTSAVRSRGYWKAKAIQLEAERSERQAAAAIKMGPAQRYLSLSGGVQMAVRRNCGNASALAVSSLLGVDVSHVTLSTWEQRCAAALMLEARLYFKTAATNMCDFIAAGGFAFAIHRISGDATNSKVFKQSKVQCLEVNARHYFAADTVASVEDVEADPVSVWPDLQIVEDGTGAGCLAMVEKQIAACGCPSWKVAQPSTASVWCYTSDAGTDQKMFRRLVLSQLAQLNLPNYFFSIDCLMHQVHLIICRQLSLVDVLLKGLGVPFPGAYWSAITKLMHLWRDTGMTRTIADKFSKPAHHACEQPAAVVQWCSGASVSSVLVSAPAWLVAPAFLPISLASGPSLPSQHLQPHIAI
jgi:hypothetical protein